MAFADEFLGRSALITGGTRGIGKGIADRLRAGGATVLVAARSAPDGASDDVIAADVSTADGVSALGAEALDRLGSVDVLVHNVGGSGQYDGGAAALTDEDWQSALDANLLAAVRLDRAIIPGMIARGSGAIVHVTSIQRRAPLPTSIPYAAAKAALTNYSKALSNELGPKGIRVNAVCPGYIETQMTRDAMRRRGDAIMAQTPMGRMGQPGEIAEMVAWLCSDRASYVTGACYNVDGGWMAV